MLYRSFLIASLSGAAFANLDKPYLDPPTDQDKQKAGYEQYLPETSYTISMWSDDQVPKWCYDSAQEHHVDITTTTAFDITYTDCEQPWTFCLAADNGATPDGIAKVFGKIPVGMRSFVRHLYATPGLGDGAAAFTTPSTGDQTYEFPPDAHTLIHETSHTIDAHIDPAGEVSSSQAWLDAYNADSHVFSSYGQLSQVEDFAEAGLYAVYDKNVPGGIASIEPNISQVASQLAAYETAVGENVTKPGGTCQNRFENSPPVSKSGGSAKFRRRAPKPMPKDIEIIEPLDEATVIKDERH